MAYKSVRQPGELDEETRALAQRVIESAEADPAIPWVLLELEEDEPDARPLTLVTPPADHLATGAVIALGGTSVTTKYALDGSYAIAYASAVWALPTGRLEDLIPQGSPDDS